MKSVQEQNLLEMFKPLFRKYGSKKHPLDHKNRCQLVVMVVLSAGTSDKNVNAIAPPLFDQFPSMKEFAAASPEDLFPFIRKIPGFVKKGTWITQLARQVGDDVHIPHALVDLTKLPGIGRKSANVIMSESGEKMEGVIVDLHTVRVVPRIGIATGGNPVKIEQQLMEKFPQQYWKKLGMSLTFLGREICRPTNPGCERCPVNGICKYYHSRT